MEEDKRNKGRRPRKKIKKECYITIKCTLYEKKIIESKAKAFHLNTSEYLRELGLTGKINQQNITAEQKYIPYLIESFNKKMLFGNFR